MSYHSSSYRRYMTPSSGSGSYSGYRVRRTYSSSYNNSPASPSYDNVDGGFSVPPRPELPPQFQPQEFATGVPDNSTTYDNAKTEEEKACLKLFKVDFNITENAERHHTSEYEMVRYHMMNGKMQDPKPVLRRGEPFDITLNFDRAFDRAKDDIKLIFEVVGAPSPRESRGTKVSMMLSDVDLPKEWGAKLMSQQDNKATVRIFTPPNISIAKWTFKFDTVIKSGDSQKTFRYSHPEPVYFICNPWCHDDMVYMDDVASREEFVLNDRGRIFRGTQKQISAKPWNFGQFEDFVLETAMYLLDESIISYRKRGDPIQLVRKISAMTNAPDDSGVLIGNWSGDYSGGTSPLFWNGSVRILEEFWRTKKPVKYGQCWVFSGVVTTLCRALGIPCRSVTNFASAHDTDGSITIDTHWTPDGQPLENMNEDSVWNFHVWNDAWMARPDLPSGFGGWQAIDATPQETSEGVYCCGPASVEALKNGLVNLLYDAPFVFAEVNADRINWIQRPDGSWANTKKNSAVGKHLSTKAIGSDDRHDVTICYKFPEGSQQERTAVWRAIKEGGSSKQDVYTASIEDMVFDLVEKDKVLYGDPFDIQMKVTNNAKVDRVVKVTMTATVVYYTGVPVRQIKSETYNCKCPVGADGEVSMEVSVEEYMNKLVDMCNIKISCMAQVEDTKQFYCDSDDFRLYKPDLEVKAPEMVKVGEEYDVEVTFTNPLPRALTKCEFQLEGASIQRPMLLKHNTIPPKGEGKVSAKLKAVREGQREIIAGFDSKELSDLSGAAKIRVLPADPAPPAESVTVTTPVPAN